MPKRFTLTERWKKKWIRQLNPKHKLVMLYLEGVCDHAGVYDVDIDTLNFELGAWKCSECGHEEKYSEEEILKVFNRKIIVIKADKWFLKKFIQYQYGKQIEELDPKSSIHAGVLRILEKYNLTKLVKKDKNKEVDSFFTLLSKWYHNKVFENYPNLAHLQGTKFEKAVNVGADELAKLERINKKSRDEIKKVLEYVVDSWSRGKEFTWLRNMQSLSSIRGKLSNGIMKYEGILNSLEQDSVVKFKLSDYRKDITGTPIGYCAECGKSDFYDKFEIFQDSRCCKAKILPTYEKN